MRTQTYVPLLTFGALGAPKTHQKRNLDFSLIFGTALVIFLWFWFQKSSIWLSFGSVSAPVGSLWVPFGSLLVHFGSLLVPLGSLLLALEFNFSILGPPCLNVDIFTYFRRKPSENSYVFGKLSFAPRPSKNVPKTQPRFSISQLLLASGFKITLLRQHRRCLPISYFLSLCFK